MSGIADQFLQDAGVDATAKTDGGVASQFLADAQTPAAVPSAKQVPAQSPIDAAAGIAPGGKVDALVQGANDAQNAAAQWLYNSLPGAVRGGIDSADHWLYTHTGGVLGVDPSLNLNSAIAKQNADYEARRKSAGREGIDWSRGFGQTGGQLVLAAPLTAAGMPAPTGMGAGALSGALTPDTSLGQGADQSGQFFKDKAADIGTGAIFGGALSKIGDTLASTIKPKVSAAAQYLLDQGVPLTPGQILGGSAKWLEDKMTSVPLLGDAIKGAQQRAGDALNTAAYKQVVDPLQASGFTASIPSKIGRDGVADLTQQVKDAYDVIVPKMTFSADPAFNNQLGSLTAMAAQGLEPQQKAVFDNLVQNKVLGNLTAQGNASGKTLQGILSDLGAAAEGYRHDPNFANRQLGDAILTMRQSVEDAMARQNPSLASQFSGVQRAFANLARIQSAAAMQGAPNGVFSAAQLAAAVKAGDKTVRDNAYAQGRALMQNLSDPAKQIMGGTVPNSGTADRALAAGALGAILAHPAVITEHPYVLAGALPALAYTKPGQKLAQYALTARPAGAQRLADQVRQGAGALALPFTNSMAPALRGALAAFSPNGNQ